jgi:cyanate permease
MTSNRWLILSIAAGLYVCFGFVSSSIAPLIGPISHDLQVSATQMGAVLGMWQLVYVVTALLVGLCLDRFGMRRTLAVGMLIVAVSSVVRGFAGDFFALVLAVGLFGIGGPTISISVPKLVAALFPERDRATALGVAMASPYFGNLIAFSASNAILLPLLGSWRGIMFLYGAVTVAVVLIWWFIAPRNVAGAPAGTGAVDAGGRSTSLRDLMRLRNVAVVLGGAALLFGVSHGSNNWIVPVLQTHSYGASEAGYWAAIANGLSAIGAIFIPRFVPSHQRRVALVIVLSSLALSMLGLVLLEGVALNLAITVFGLARTVPMPLYFLVLIDTPGVGSRHMGVVGGAFFAVAEIGGFGGPFVLGALFDQFGSFVPGFVVLFAMAIVLAAMAGLLQERKAVEPELAAA